MRIKTNKFLTYMILSVLYCIVAIVCDVSYAISSIVMAIAMFIVLLFGYNRDEPLTSINNLFIMIFYVIGIFGRYLFILLYPDIFQEFSAVPLEETTTYHLKTQLFLLITFVFFSLGKAVCKKNKNRYKKKKKDENIELNNKAIFHIVYFMLAIVVFSYRFRFSVSAVSNTYNTFDYLFTVLTQYLKFVAYYHLYNYVKERKATSLFVYIVYVFPQVLLSLINAWKGTLVLEIVIVFIVLYIAHVKIKPRTYILSGFAILLVFFVITNYRTVLIHGGSLQFGYSGIKDYLREDFFKQLTNRFEEYDLVYYTINSPVGRIEYLRDNSLTIFQTFIRSIIPRVIWYDKGVVSNLPLLIKQYFFGHAGIYSNSNVTFLGESYISYGWIGSVLISFIYGIMCNYLEPTESSKFSVARYALIASCILQFYEGNISGKIILLLLSLIIMSVVKKACFIVNYALVDNHPISNHVNDGNRRI